MVRVFSQAPVDQLSLPALVRSATRFFDAELDVLGVSEPPRPGLAELEFRLRVQVARTQIDAAFAVRGRAARETDFEAADAAEARGRSGGMASLARRCKAVLEVDALNEAEFAKHSRPAAEHLLSAVLASVLLGPVLPEDGVGLYGVRGAMTRYEQQVGPSLLRPSQPR